MYAHSISYILAELIQIKITNHLMVILIGGVYLKKSELILRPIGSADVCQLADPKPLPFCPPVACPSKAERRMRGNPSGFSERQDLKLDGGWSFDFSNTL
ncbi:MAG: hypothetical protein A3G08_01860 [Candidatus Magasanikbacteria bacterium RIFCSPLOWO2_12_FULL_47_9b]|uniref:Uncharacterized protein n=1 Tax=Candidatus Magasanikbacteria bacterium GW2011_GWA2_42_32 TaxID=1619039 RepID=A0A0G1A3S2_9BACT|nr:MAG: hypothetical protein UV20_C0025G0004 [Candidatus Magasanikbacteria bacterium GW2011_GWA2_42_32]OGH79279.1 MAG: hypothetical protein A3I74_00060 [Candidatus Magasanikbacteria bacterium RIFCSPLOWO2_02_FULL_47_16]OGH80284.1 MAG: hypothetical protein A3C10_03895 [Candidatus Magasanikbacteria bacterium RIFCSPHIGHO2_02_FULL_48_18]OGH82196.1 MAG: hypothetical protein A3G08_01860 [Candidatus Magasanikbacteria bacterium RIFCSPLOWO2_12_FULL_47_9b]